MNTKMKACFTPHIIMHSLIGLGLGIALATLVPSLQNVWIGVIIIAFAVALDMMRKKQSLHTNEPVMKPKHLIIGTIIALVILMGLVLMLKGGRTSNSENIIKTNLSQQLKQGSICRLTDV